MALNPPRVIQIIHPASSTNLMGSLPHFVIKTNYFPKENATQRAKGTFHF